MELTLTEGQWQLVYNAFSFVFAAMLAAGVFFVLARTFVAPKYRMALTISTLVVTIAGYHYLRIFDSWANGFARLTGGDYEALGIFNEGYRYVDWLLTVPLLLAELVLLLGLAKKLERSMIIRLGSAAALMIVLGYPGEISGATGSKWAWWIGAMIPFAYIIWVLFTEFGKALADQTPRVASLLKGMRALLVVSWFFYPIAYLVPLTGLDASTAEVARQLGYSVSDVIAKAVFGFILYTVARAKSEEEGFEYARTA